MIPTSFEIQDFVDVPFLRQFSFHDFIVRIFHHKSPGNALMVGRQLDRCHGLQDPKFLAVSGSPSISMGFSMGFSIMNHPFWGNAMESPRPQLQLLTHPPSPNVPRWDHLAQSVDATRKRPRDPSTAAKAVKCGDLWHRKFKGSGMIDDVS